MRAEFRDERKERILKNAAELFAAKGFENIMMIDIAKASDMAVGTLYNYYSSKTALLAGIFASKLKSLFDGTKKKPENVYALLASGFSAYVSFGRNNWKFFMTAVYKDETGEDLKVWESQHSFVALISDTVEKELTGTSANERIGGVGHSPVNKVTGTTGEAVAENKSAFVSKLVFQLFFQGFQKWIHTGCETDILITEISQEVKMLLDMARSWRRPG